jgi:hypothetical protein
MLGTQHGHLGITRPFDPKQAQFEPEYFLALTTTVQLIGQCLKDVGLTELNKVVRKQCLDDIDLAKASFKK